MEFLSLAFIEENSTNDYQLKVAIITCQVLISEILIVIKGTGDKGQNTRAVAHSNFTPNSGEYWNKKTLFLQFEFAH